MDLFECIKNRRSVRSYLEKPVEKEKIEKLLEAGASAPSAMNKQPCHFTVVENKGKLRYFSDRAKAALGALGMGLRVAEMIKVKEDVIFYNAPLLIVISTPKDAYYEGNLDSALAAENMFLAGREMGLGSCYIGFAMNLNKDKEALKELGIPDDYHIVSPLIFGYPKEWPTHKEKEPKMLKWIK
jgi:nitroreductase